MIFRTELIFVSIFKTLSRVTALLLVMVVVFLFCGQKSCNRYLWKSLTGEVRAVCLCHKYFSFKKKPHDFDATQLCIAASRLLIFLLGIAFLCWTTVGSLRAEGTLGGHSVQNPGPSTVGCDVRPGSSWL